MTETVWICDQFWAGQIYNRTLFGTREEAEEFVIATRRAEPDHIFSIEAMEAAKLWN